MSSVQDPKCPFCPGWSRTGFPIHDDHRQYIKGGIHEPIINQDGQKPIKFRNLKSCFGPHEITTAIIPNWPFMMLVDDYRGLKSPAIINVATKLLSMPGFISNSPPRDMVFATWRKVFIRDTRKVNARNTGAVNVLRATTNRQEQLETFLESAAWFPAKCLNGRLNNSRTLSFWQFRRTLPRCST